ncbi:MAG: UDP-N-acetylmuramate--L-alanine ligase [Anaerolineales bacterium]|nr:UDP-N-acetylmuramate--L-alanine ligase [Anaerolineales bacterium]
MKRRVHFVGIGGAGLSAIARILKNQGDEISGSDLIRSPYAAALEDLGIQIMYEHKAENIQKADFIIASSAISDSNIELEAARDAGIPVYRRDAFLPEMLRQYRVIGIAGTHGKTTTTGLISFVLDSAGLQPSFIVGGILENYQTNAGSGSSSLFVIEADEYARTFLSIYPSIAVITTVEHDHPDCYPTAEDFQAAFQEYVHQAHDAVVLCLDDPGAARLKVDAPNRITYGFDPSADWRAENQHTEADGLTVFDVFEGEKKAGTFRTQLHGRHNVLNILAAWSVCDFLGMEIAAFQKHLEGYRGVSRRFEVLGEVGDIAVIDDYAHHPTEIKATLSGAREAYPGRKIHAVFQPHTYSRLRQFFEGFTQAFCDADSVIVTSVFAAREPKDETLGGRQLAEGIDHPQVIYKETFSEAVDYLYSMVVPPAVVLTLSAGDGNEIGKMLLQRLKSGMEASDA